VSKIKRRVCAKTLTKVLKATIEKRADEEGSGPKGGVGGREHLARQRSESPDVRVGREVRSWA